MTVTADEGSGSLPPAEHDPKVYYQDTSTVTASELLHRLEAAYTVASELETIFRRLRNTANARGFPWPASLESILAHMSIDMQYLKAELLQMLDKEA